jgi:hypothetical protein
MTISVGPVTANPATNGPERRCFSHRFFIFNYSLNC